MSHKTVYMCIPQNKLKGNVSKEHITEIVAETLAKYVEDTAEDGMMKIDWYEIGGRWAGAFATLKSATSAFLTENGLFAYEFLDKYDVICNGGQRGPYIAGCEEFMPVNGAYNHEIAWNALAKLRDYYLYKYMLMILDGDERLGGHTPDGMEIIDDCLFLMDDEHTLWVKKGETFDERNERLGKKFGRGMMPPDAYVDLNGVWHDDNDIWEKWEKGGPKAMEKVFASGKDPQEIALEEFNEEFEQLLSSLQPNDYVIVIDGHAFP